MERKLGKSTTPIFQFAEVLPDTMERRTYIYQDLSVDYVEYMHDHLPETFQVSNFQIYTNAAICRRKTFQKMIIRNEVYFRISGERKMA